MDALAHPIAGHALRLDGVTRLYGASAAVRDVTLDVERGEFLTLLGPSGSGKTTLLTMIAGFVAPSAGRILLDGADITALPAERRHFGMVFQGYALFPHMSVAENVAFPLRVRRLGRAEREAKVRGALDLVRLGHLAERKPSQLSGGQQQRVALARALVFEPDLLLLDEPLSALDRKLRGELQEELRALHRRVGRTFINVTHDQEEALSLSDRIAILEGGRLVQAGSPTELYERPRTRFVAGFLGQANFLEGEARPAPGGFEMRRGGTVVRFAGPVAAPGRVVLSLRPERVALLRDGQAPANAVEGRVRAATYLGAGHSLLVETQDLGALRVLVAGGAPPPREGEAVRLGWEAAAAVPVLDESPLA